MSGSAASAVEVPVSPYDLSVQLLISVHRLKKNEKREKTTSQLEKKVKVLLSQLSQLFSALDLDPIKTSEDNMKILKKMDAKNLGFTLWMLGRVLVAARMLDDFGKVTCGEVVVREDPYQGYENLLVAGLLHAKTLMGSGETASSPTVPATTLWAHAYLLVAAGLEEKKALYDMYKDLFYEVSMAQAETAAETLSNQMWVNGMYLYAHSFPLVARRDCFRRTKEALVQDSQRSSVVEAALVVVTPKDWGMWFSATVCLALHQADITSIDAHRIKQSLEAVRDIDPATLKKEGYHPHDLTLAELYLH